MARYRMWGEAGLVLMLVLLRGEEEEGVPGRQRVTFTGSGKLTGGCVVLTGILC